MPFAPIPAVCDDLGNVATRPTLHKWDPLRRPMWAIMSCSQPSTNTLRERNHDITDLSVIMGNRHYMFHPSSMSRRAIWAATPMRYQHVLKVLKHDRL